MNNIQAVDINDIVAAIGYVADSGEFVHGVDDVLEIAQDGFFDDQDLQFVSWDEAKEALMDYVSEYGTDLDLKDCPVLLNGFFNKHSDKRFFLFGVEADLNIGVCPAL